MRSSRLSRIQRGKPFEIEVDGQLLLAFPGETIATAMLAAGKQIFSKDENGYAPSRLFCNMGLCQQCLVTVDHQPNCQACKTLAQPGMKVNTHT